INLSIDPATGVVTPQTNLNPGNPNVVGSSYTNSFAGANATTLYAIDSNTDQLFTQVPAAGTLTLVGNLGVDTTGQVGFDISPVNNQAFASLTPSGATSSRLYSINLATGAATLIGTIGRGTTLRALASRTPTVLSFSGNASFVSQLYFDLLGRLPDTAGGQAAIAFLEQGGSRIALINGFLQSLEYRTLVAQSLYQRFLGRQADTVGLD